MTSDTYRDLARLIFGADAPRKQLYTSAWHLNMMHHVLHGYSLKLGFPAQRRHVKQNAQYFFFQLCDLFLFCRSLAIRTLRISLEVILNRTAALGLYQHGESRPPVGLYVGVCHSEVSFSRFMSTNRPRHLIYEPTSLHRAATKSKAHRRKMAAGPPSGTCTAPSPARSQTAAAAPWRVTRTIAQQRT